jgi:hypothetical protein
MTQYTTAASVVSNALTAPDVFTPTASDTFTAGCFGPQGMRLDIITTGTLTNVAVTDPGFTPVGNAGTAASLAAPATGRRMLLVPLGAINPATGVATVTFSGALTGVTAEKSKA